MNIQKAVQIPILLVILAFLAGCDVMGTIIPSAGTYKLNAQTRGIPLNECSFVSFGDNISPFFEESVSNDPDITALLVFLRNSSGQIIGDRVRYSLDDKSEPNEIVIPVNSLDKDLPSFPIPENLPFGRYTMVSQVMSEDDILQRTETPFFYLGNTSFSFEGINVHLPGITDNAQLISREMVVLLEADMDFDSRLDPFIVWYNGRKKISEGKFSEGAGSLFWQAPDQSGFFSISAEIFPIEDFNGLAGYQKEVSLLVSSKTADLNLISEDTEQLVHWFVFDGNLNSSKTTASEELSLKPVAENAPQWIAANGIYGLAAGDGNAFTLPKVWTSNYEMESWQALFRFKPLSEGGIISVIFDSSPDISMDLSIEGQNLILTLVSPLSSVSQTLKLPEHDSFQTAAINFSIFPGLLKAEVNIIDSAEQDELTAEPVYLEAETGDNFRIILGGEGGKPFTAIWDEFALYNMPSIEVIAAADTLKEVYQAEADGKTHLITTRTYANTLSST